MRSLSGAAAVMVLAVTLSSMAANRPYEFDWANRAHDEFPPVARLETAEGWRVVCDGAEATIATTNERALFGPSVVRLAYRATGTNPVVRLLPMAPIPVPDGSDTLSLWVYGNNIRGDRCPPVEIAAVFEGSETQSGKVERTLGTASHLEWHLMTSVGKPLPKGSALTGLVLRRGTNTTWQTLDVTSLGAFADPKRSIAVPPRAKRGVVAFPECPQGLNTGAGRLPFPNRADTVMPPTAALSKKLEFRLPKNTADWSDLAFRYGDSDWIPLAVGGGLKGASGGVTFRRVGNSLVCEIRHPEPNVEAVRFGVARFPAGVKSVEWPFYTWRWLRPSADAKSGPERFRPRIAALRIGGKPLFVGAVFDWTQSNASLLVLPPKGREGDFAFTGDLLYLPKTDGMRNGCFERLVWTFAEDVADVFPAIPNPDSPYRAEAGAGSWTSYHARDRVKDADYWRRAKAAGIARVIITDHETGWRDGMESFTFRTRPAPGKGGDEGQRKYARALIDELGYRYGPYNNFMDFAPVNGYWSIDRVARFPDGSLVPAWHRCYSPKATWAVGMCERLAPEIQRKFHFNTAYCDVHTCISPWDRVDSDARAPGAGTFAQVFYCYGEIMLMQKKAWGGPVYSEGGIHWLYAGLTDGNYGADPEYDFMTRPWLVDFDLRRLHEKGCNFGMGNPWMFYYIHDTGKVRKRDPQLWMDCFTAATLAYGHPGFLICNGGKEDFAVEKESYYPVQAIAARYTQAEATAILYAAADGRFYGISEALFNGAAALSHVKIVYSDGTVVAVNGNPKEDFALELGGVRQVLPPYGWYAATADGAIVSYCRREGNRRVKYAKSPEYEWNKDVSQRMSTKGENE